MAKTIDTLVEDIHKVFQLPHEFDEERLQRFGKRLAKTVANKVNVKQSQPTLRMSNVGSKCDRKLWYGINQPNDAETVPVHARIKFLYGDVLEELLLFLAEEAGHTVEGCQDELDIGGIKGHRDAIIDGVVVDCKSASSYSFKKFKEGLKTEDDGFGYLDQLQSYLYASQEDEKVTDKSRAAFLVIDKTLGHICLDIHKKSGKDYPKLFEQKKVSVALKTPPPRAYSDTPEGKSGNRKLGMECGYCPFKKTCWPGLRTFIYANGPTYLTVVEKLPNVPEA
jgi:hypothetical protein